MKFEDRADASDIRITDDGYLVADVRCAKVGVQQYMASDVGLPGHGLVNVYRPESTVFNKDSLATFAGKPVTLQHPPELVNAENWKQYAVGDVGEDILRDGEFIRVPIKLMDAAAIEAVKNGTREISMGYSCDIKHEDGVTPEGEAYNAVQVGPIRINHLAIVDKARGGSKLRIGDSAIEKWGAIPINDSQRSEKGGRMPDMKTVVLGDAAVQVALADAQAIEQFKAATAKQLSDSAAKHDAAIAAKDADMAKMQAQLDDANTKILSDADLDKRVAERAELVSVAAKISPDVKTSGMSDSAIRKAVVVAKLGDAAITGKSDAYVDARFDILADAAKTETNPVQVALSKGVTVNVGDAASAEAAALAKANDFNAWRNQ